MSVSDKRYSWRHWFMDFLSNLYLSSPFAFNMTVLIIHFKNNSINTKVIGLLVNCLKMCYKLKNKNWIIIIMVVSLFVAENKQYGCTILFTIVQVSWSIHPSFHNHCVAGQSMGPDGYGGECLGCGNQENFINCADIAIGATAIQPLPPLPADATPPTPPPEPAYSTIRVTRPAPKPQPQPVYEVTNAAPNNNNNNINNNNNNNNNNMDANLMLMKQLYQKLIESQQAAAQPQQWATPGTPAPSQWKQPEPVPPPSWSQPQTPAPWQQQTPQPWQPAADVHYPGYEPGEYPEQGEFPSSGGGGGSQYMQGFNDALRQFQESFGLSAVNMKSKAPFSEASMSYQDSQKNFGGPSGVLPGMCPDGSEMECRATSNLQGSDFDSFCQSSCIAGQCPTNLCACTCPSGNGDWVSAPQAANSARGNCHGLDRAKGESMDQWCTLNCQKNNCPSDLCVCFWFIFRNVFIYLL